MKTLIFISAMIIGTLGISQTSNKELKQIKEELSVKYINDLNRGVLLVRLKTKSTTINALKEHGQLEKAKKVEKEVLEFNVTLIQAFKSNFNFCDVYFFTSDYTSRVKNKQFNEVFFLDDKGEVDENITPNPDVFLIAEYGSVEADTVTYYQGTHTQQGKEGLETRDTYSGRGSFGFEALLMRNDQFVQLSDPFPYYIKTWDSAIKPAKVVKKLNKKLHQFYNGVRVD